MSIEQTLAERGNRYGDFADHAEIAQSLQRVMHKAVRASPVVGQTARPLAWECLNNVQRQALTVIADKIARILSGDPNYADNWHDIQGYAKLVEDRLPPEIPADFGQQHTIEPASLIDDESPRQQLIQQGGEMAAEVYGEIDRLLAAEAFNADLPVTVDEAIALGAAAFGSSKQGACESCESFERACDGSCCGPA